MKKFKKLPMAFIPPFPCIREVSLKKTEGGSLDRITTNRIFETIRQVKTAQDSKVRWILEKDPITNTRSLVRARIGFKLFCPTTFYCFVKTGMVFSIFEADKAANESDVPNAIRAEIDDAADNVGDPALRRRLLQVTGLLEQARKNGKRYEKQQKLHLTKRFTGQADKIAKNILADILLTDSDPIQGPHYPRTLKTKEGRKKPRVKKKSGKSLKGFKRLPPEKI